MSLLASLDRRDRRLLLITAALVACTTVLLVLVNPQEQPDNYIPSTYSSAPHGAKAAYLLLSQLGYPVQRSEGPLDSVADTADAHTVLILAEPTRAPSRQEAAAVKRVLARGGRVLAAGFLSAAALPDENLDSKSPPELIRRHLRSRARQLLTACGRRQSRDARRSQRMESGPAVSARRLRMRRQGRGGHVSGRKRLSGVVGQRIATGKSGHRFSGQSRSAAEQPSASTRRSHRLG